MPCAPSLRERLRRVPDVERALSRLSLGRGGPRDLAAVRDALAEVPGLRGLLRASGGIESPPSLVPRSPRIVGRA